MGLELLGAMLLYAALCIERILSRDKASDIIPKETAGTFTVAIRKKGHIFGLDEMQLGHLRSLLGFITSINHKIRNLEIEPWNYLSPVPCPTHFAIALSRVELNG